MGERLLHQWAGPKGSNGMSLQRVVLHSLDPAFCKRQPRRFLEFSMIPEFGKLGLWPLFARLEAEVGSDPLRAPSSKTPMSRLSSNVQVFPLLKLFAAAIGKPHPT